MAPTDKLKQSLYFYDDTLQEIAAEANRLDRSLSWIVQRAWSVAREQVRSFPAAHVRRDVVPDSPSRPSEQPRPSANRSPDAQSGRPSDQVLEFLRGKFDHGLR
jgi:uncharacterized small protein (TIGR04563 family)